MTDDAGGEPMVPIGTAWTNAKRRVRGDAPREPPWRDAELLWYANERDGEMGLRAAPIETGVDGDPEVNDGISDHQLRAATRSRKIEAALAALPPEDRLLLIAVHTVLRSHGVAGEAEYGASKARRDAQARCIEKHLAEILAAVETFRRSLRGGKC